MKPPYFEEILKNKPTKTIEVEGIGTVNIYGSFDTEKIVKRLLQSDNITGR